MKIQFCLVLCVFAGFGAVLNGWAAAAKPTKEEIRKQEAEIKAARVEAKAEARAKAEADAKSRAEAKAKEKAEREEKAKAAAKLEAAQEGTQPHWGPYFIGYELEPSMDAGGMLVTTVHRGLSDVGERWTRRFPYVRFPYELLFAIGLSTVQHEVFGHGARGREYNLEPSYGFGLDLSGYTEVKKEPANNLDLAALCAGGTEADMVMARRLLLDSCQPGGSPASSTFLMFFGKVDLSVYVLSTSKPKPGRAGGGQESTFTDDYEGGNDIAIYLATRQAQRVGAAPRDVWNRDYQLDFEDPLLNDTYDQAHDMAIWNLVDPMMWGSMVLYVKDHLIQGKRVATAPAIPLGGDFGLTVGTRGALGPDAISRFLDLYLLTPTGVFSVYGRDIRAADDATMGFGAGLYRMPAGPVKLSASADFWSNPEAPEGFYDDDSGWNVCGEAEIHVADPLSLWLKAGQKSDGFFPGTPTDSGPYVGGGVLLAF